MVAAAGQDESVRQQLEEAQKAEILAITQEIRQRDSSVGIQEAKRRAEQVVTNAYGVLARNIEVEKTFSQKLVKAAKDMLKATKDRIKALKTQTKQSLKDKGVGGTLQAGAGVVGRGIGKGAQNAAQGLGGAQNLAFAGAAIGGVVASLGIFEEATNKAAAEIIAFGTTSLGLIATLAQTVAGFTASAAASGASAAADQAQAIASGQATIADQVEATASLGAAAVTGILVVSVVAAVSALYFWSAQAKATADKAGKDFDDALASIDKGAVGTSAKLKAAAELEINSRAESAKTFNATAVSIVVGAVAAGAAIGSIVPIFGTANGAIVGGLIAAGVALFV